jgi:hypothetical protein
VLVAGVNVVLQNVALQVQKLVVYGSQAHQIVLVQKLQNHQLLKVVQQQHVQHVSGQQVHGVHVLQKHVVHQELRLVVYGNQVRQDVLDHIQQNHLHQLNVMHLSVLIHMHGLMVAGVDVLQQNVEQVVSKQGLIHVKDQMVEQ